MSNLTIKQRRMWGYVIRYILAAILITFAIFPVLWILSSSLNPSNTLASASLIPENIGLGNYYELFNTPERPFGLWIWNSIKISTITTILSVTITTFAAYAFSRFRFRARVNMLKAILLIQVFPSLLALIAVFTLVTQFESIVPAIGLDTHAGLILVYLGGAMGVNVWLMKGFFDTIPRVIDESAMVDGATHWQVFTQLLLPLMRPMLIVVAILTFIGTYGDFVLARVLLKSTDQYPLMVGLFILTSGQFSQQWGPFAAGALLGAAPVMIIYLLLQDQIVGGLTQGAVKG
ncbi:MAG: sugar ABC transporter permease [Anaerolineae bacterium]